MSFGDKSFVEPKYRDSSTRVQLVKGDKKAKEKRAHSKFMLKTDDRRGSEDSKQQSGGSNDSQNKMESQQSTPHRGSDQHSSSLSDYKMKTAYSHRSVQPG